MGFKKQKKSKLINLMDLPSKDRVRLIMKMRVTLAERIRTAKICKTFLYYDNLTINGYVVYNNY